jgi:hypothetical protein
METVRSPVGPLLNGNRRGNPETAPRCGARTRAGTVCRAPAVRRRKRCRLHGGASTGPRTPEGLERSRRARWKHGRYSKAAREKYLLLKAECRAITVEGTTWRAALFSRIRVLSRRGNAARRNARRRERRRWQRMIAITLRREGVRTHHVPVRLVWLASHESVQIGKRRFARIMVS